MNDEVRDGAMEGAPMQYTGATREVRVVREASGQTIRIPAGFEIASSRAVIRRDGDKLVIDEEEERPARLPPSPRSGSTVSFRQVGDESLPPLDEPDL